jgi:hypothetical protein
MGRGTAYGPVSPFLVEAVEKLGRGCRIGNKWPDSRDNTNYCYVMRYDRKSILRVHALKIVFNSLGKLLP